MTFKIQVVGIKATQKYLNNKKNEVKAKEASGIKKATLFLEGAVKTSIATEQWVRKDGTTGPSVDKGDFLASVHSKAFKDNGIVFSNSPYANWLEYGTSRRAKLYSGARKHFRNTAAKKKATILKIIKGKIKTI